MKTLSGNIYRIMRHRLMTGSLPPGQRISEHALAKEFGVSRGPIREAIGKLSGERLLERLPNNGTFVRRSSRQELADLYQVRAWLEGEAAFEAAGKITDVELSQLEQVCNQMAEAVDKQREVGKETMVESDNEHFAMNDLKFHLSLVKASGNTQALKMLADQHIISRACATALVPKFLPGGYQSYREHMGVFEALRARKSDLARQLVRQHILGALDPLLAEYDRREAKRSRDNPIEDHMNDLEKALREIENSGGTVSLY